MKKIISNSIVADDNSIIDKATIKNISSSDNKYSDGITIDASVVAQHGSKVTNASIDISKERRQSFWNGFSIGSIITSIIASAIWYFIQQIFEK
jgi:hypothetical protein